MNKIPTLFRRDPADMSKVTREVHPDCRWVIDGEGMATRKYDGTCVLLDEDGWWARREVKPGKAAPNGYRPISTDEVTGKTVGWEPIEQSAFYRFWKDAFENDPRYEGISGGYPQGTYELCGPRVNSNPERFVRHSLILHEHADRLVVPLDYDRLANWMAETDFEGIVWHHPDGRMAKLKKRDFR